MDCFAPGSSVFAFYVPLSIHCWLPPAGPQGGAVIKSSVCQFSTLQAEARLYTLLSSLEKRAHPWLSSKTSDKTGGKGFNTLWKCISKKWQCWVMVQLFLLFASLSLLPALCLFSHPAYSPNHALPQPCRKVPYISLSHWIYNSQAIGESQTQWGEPPALRGACRLKPAFCLPVRACWEQCWLLAISNLTRVLLALTLYPTLTRCQSCRN